jgi:maltooligosyltrehalose synthase
MLRIARAEAERRGIVNIEFHTPAELEAARRTFDFITCYLVLQRMPPREGLALTRRLLALRNASPALFREGDYAPVRVEGEHRDHVVAFARSRGSAAVIVAVGRHFSRFTNGGREWPCGGRWRASLVTNGFGPVGDLLVKTRSFPGNEIPVADLFATMPFAVLRPVPP